MKYIVAIFLFVVILARHNATAQVAPISDNHSGLKIEIGIPGDVIRPQDETILEIKMTNEGQTPIKVWGFWDALVFDMRDAQNNAVPRSVEWLKSEEERASRPVLKSTSPIVLAPGLSLTHVLILEKLFILNHSSEYSMQVTCQSFGTQQRVASNLLHFSIAEPSNRASSSPPEFSIQAHASQPFLPAGWAVPFDIVVANTGSRSLRWAIPQEHMNWAPDEFGMGIEIYTGKDLPTQLPQRKPVWGTVNQGFFDNEEVELLSIPPGKSAEQIVAIGNYFDIGTPAGYQAKVALIDPASNLRVESKPASFEIEDASMNHSGSSVAPRPPFMVTIRQNISDSPRAHDDPSAITMCTVNISDHPIEIGNAADDLFAIEDPDGSQAKITNEKTILYQKQRSEMVVGPKRPFSGQATEPRWALCGGRPYGTTFDHSRPGAYRIRIGTYDFLDAAQGQKFGELPVVYSNWLTFFENSPNPKK